MPRADPARSDYCASRHLLRNLDDASELRRNPLVREYFTDAVGAPHRRDAATDRGVLERIRDDVRASLARCSDHTGRCTHVALGRMRAALLRCDIDDQPAPAVAAELGLSERQLRRERRAAHDAFLRAFRTAPRGSPPATACDVATVRLAQAVELHELGQAALAQSAFASIAAHAPAAERRIEALCLAAEAELDALQFGATAAHLDAARALMARHARDLGVDVMRAADEHIDFVAWLLRWQTAVSAGFATQPPLALVPADDVPLRDERRRALFVRAAAAYAMQRWEVGAYEQGCGAVRRALDVVPMLHATRTKERLAVIMADTQLFGLRAPVGTDCDRFEALEQLASSHGHVRSMLAARAERIISETALGRTPAGRAFTDILSPFGTAERRWMARTFAWAAQLVAQCASNPRDFAASAQLAEALVPPRDITALGTRCVRANAAIDDRRFDDARPIAESLYSDAEWIGNGRLRGAAARSLAAIAFGCRRRTEAQRYIRESLALTERYGSPEALARANALARRLDVA